MKHKRLSVTRLHIHFQSEYPRLPSWSVNFEYTTLINGDTTEVSAKKQFKSLDELLRWVRENLSLGDES